jgi:polar amino acid transport system substrate-binding protein
MKTIICLLLSLLLLNPCARAETMLKLGSSYYPPITTPQHDGVLDLAYSELSKRLGIKIAINDIETAERVLLNANSGIDDGDVGRVSGMEKHYPNLRRVPAPVYHYEMVVFSKNDSYSPVNANEVKTHDIGILRGWKILEEYTEGAPSVTSLESGEQLFTMLEKNRIEIALFEKSQGLSILKQMRLKNIKVLKPNLLEGDFFLYLHKKHQNLIPRIAAELKKMHQDGTFARINSRVFKQYTVQ